jgi:hypothetical protein
MPSDTMKMMFFVVFEGLTSSKITVDEAQEFTNPNPSEPSAVFFNKSLLFILTILQLN